MSNCRGVNEWVCRRSCSCHNLGDHIQQHASPTIACVCQRNDRDIPCMEPLYGSIFYCITQNNETTYDSLPVFYVICATWWYVVLHVNPEQLF